MNRTNIHTLLLACVLFLLAARPAAAQEKLTLQQCKQLAKDNNSALRTARNNVSAAEEQCREAWTNYFPQVSATGFAFNANKDMAKMSFNTADALKDVPAEALAALPQELLGMVPSGISMGLLKNGVVGAVSAVQPVYAGGQITNGNRLAKVGADVAALQMERTENEVELTTEQYFWQIVSLKEKLNTLDAVQQMLARLEKDVAVAVKAGLSNRNDLLQVQLQANEMASQRIKVENGLTISRQLLAQYIGMDSTPQDAENAGRLIDIESPGLPEGASLAGVDVARREHTAALAATPEYRLLEKNVEASRLQHRLTVGRNMPTVGVGASYAYNDLMGKRNFGMLFASVSVPISAWWGGSHAAKRQKLAAENAREQMENGAQLLVIGMDNAWNNVTDSQKQLLLAQQSIDQSTENLRLNNDYYRAGTTTMSNLLEAQTLYQQARDRMADAYIDYRLSLLKYRQATGAERF